MSASKKKRDGDSISVNEFFRLLRDERGSQNARMKARIKARIEALMAPRRPSTIALAEHRLAEIENLQQLLNELAPSRQGRPRPESAAKAHIRAKLAEQRPDIKPAALRKLCDEQTLAHKSKAGQLVKMLPEDFRNTVAAIRREKKPIPHR